MNSAAPQPIAPDKLTDIELAGAMLLKKWCKVTGVSVRTTQRWRNDPTKNFKVFFRYGLPFLSAETIKAFCTDDGSAPGRPSLGGSNG